MQSLRRIPEAIICGLYMALLAPLLASMPFTAYALIWTSASVEEPGAGLSGIALLSIGVASASYLLGSLPAFTVGLLLPTLRRRLSALLAAPTAGLLAVACYLATFGSHLLSFPNPLASVIPIAVPAFLGVTAAAYPYVRRS